METKYNIHYMIDSRTETVGDQLYGNHEAQVSEGGEADLHMYFKNCKKNPDHQGFIPVDKFTINSLPEGHRNNNLHELIKATADLTVRVEVRKTSPHRPEFWPNTKVSYPFYNMRDKTNLRYGSGMVSFQVIKFTDGYEDDGDKHWKKCTTCWCKQCQQSDTASHIWWEFSVFTAKHVVFDDIEASHTSVRLFYDTEESPKVIVDQVRIVHVLDDEVTIERDCCVLTCVTCDKNLGDKLNMLWNHILNVWKKDFDRYFKSPDVDKLTFIVSHPHGCCKQISVGHWVDKYRVDKDKFGKFYKFSYTTCTCPGSSGARVQFMGYTIGFFQHVHSGSFNSKLNYSGIDHVFC